ncbi:MAG: PAS domain-containing protein [Cytophagales bacterium]|nr:MAG: PAS domain-containing protein [Cytophagales bacterium]
MKSKCIKYFINLFLFSLLLFSQSWGQGNQFNFLEHRGLPPIKNYTPDVYKAEPENWAIAQDNRGIMYFGNENGLLEFDGVTWNLLLEGSLVQSLAVDKKGRLYVGKVGELGYLSTDEQGNAKYISLLDKLPSKYRSFKEVWQIVITEDNRVIFQTSTTLLIWQNERFLVVEQTEANHNFHKIFIVKNRVFIRAWSDGLLELKGGHLYLVSEGEKFAQERIDVMLPYDDDKILVVARNQGIYLWDGNHFTLWQTEADEFIKTSQVYRGFLLTNQYFVIGSYQNGFIIINKEGKMMLHLNKNKGLADNTIADLEVDKHNNLWLATLNGIIYVNVNSPFSIIDEREGLTGKISNIIFNNNNLYIGTSLGIFVKDWNKNNINWQSDKNQDIILIPQSNYNNTLFSIENDVVIGGNLDEFFALVNKIMTNKVKVINALGIAKIRGKENLYLATERGSMWLFEIINGNITKKNKIEGFSDEVNGIVQGEGNSFWVFFEKSGRGVRRIVLNEEFTKIVAQVEYNKNNQLPDDLGNNVFYIDGKIIITTKKGLYEYNPQSQKIQPETEWSKYLEDFKDKHITYFTKDKQGNLWFIADSKILELQKEKQYKLNTNNFKKIEKPSYILPIDAQNIIFVAQGKIWHYKYQKQIDESYQFEVFFRRIGLLTVGTNHNIYNGFDLQKAQKYFEAEEHSFRFVFASNFYSDIEHIQYSYKLENFDEQWSEWDSRNEKDYTHLPAGTYTFKVKARNIYGIQTKEIQYTFSIASPWYTTWWALSIYFIVTVSLGYLVLRINTLRLEVQRRKLQEKVDLQTQEIKTAQKELEKTLLIEKEQKEILQTQEEEMKQNMEELMTTQEEMAKTQAELYGQLNAIHNSPILQAEYDTEGRIISANPSYVELFKTNENDKIIGASIKDILDSNYTQSEPFQELEKALKAGKALFGEFKNIRKDGKVIWLNSSYSPIKDKNETLVKVIQLAFDVTTSKRLLQQTQAQTQILQKREEQLSQTITEITALQIEMQQKTAVYESSRDAIMLLDEDLSIIDCNEATLALFIYSSKEEIIGKSPIDLSPTLQPNGKPSAEIALSKIQRAFERGSNFFEWQHQTQNGDTFDCEILLSYFEHKGKKRLASTIRDITERKAQEAEMLKINQELSATNSLVEQQKAEITRSLQDQKDINEQLAAQEEEMRMSMEELVTTQEQMTKTQIELEGQMQAINNSAILKVEFDLQGKVLFANQAFLELYGYENDEKDNLHHKIFCDPLYADSFEYEFFWEALLKQTSQAGEYQRFKKNGEIVWINALYTPVKNETGEVYKIIKLAFDITNAKKLLAETQEQAEILRTQEEEMRQNVEELLATQEALEQNKREMEMKNKKLEANESILKKSFEKMKQQELALKQNYEELQSQEEELRQNMEELQTTQEALRQQSLKIEVKNRLITASIKYAQNIQQAILPENIRILTYLKDIFVIFKPKDIVSGDFYWFAQSGKYSIIAVVDCTGHGVPGAFMSMIGNSLFNEIVNISRITSPAKILEMLHIGIRTRLKQENNSNNDGMDVVLCSIEKLDNGERNVIFAGAKRPLYCIQNNEMIILKGDRKSIGGWQQEEYRTFENQTIVLKENDLLYLSSDGMIDNPNIKRKKFGEQRLLDILLANHNKSLEEQKLLLEKAYEEHQGKVEQRDDITVLGIRL